MTMMNKFKRLEIIATTTILDDTIIIYFIPSISILWDKSDKFFEICFEWIIFNLRIGFDYSKR